MEKYLEEAPKSWKYRLVLAAVPKDGAPYEDSFSVHIDRPVSYWDQIYTFLSDPQVRVEAYRSEGRVLVTVSLRTEVSVPCARCLEPARTEVGGELRYIFSLRRDEQQREKAEESKDGEEEIIILDSWEDEIDLGQLIWEVLITALPGAVLCSPDCLGLCPQCGANLNLGPCGCKKESRDPRFDVLRNFVEDSGK
ncbi:MAG: DUF177 domain-containing protein [Cloacibacillus porcorum]|uniref:YceD family protein n=1 Tax=Cloacibacillus porcorum TaxID=1197717 RepID=UPI002352798E|nr:DUF177 domain-containing protein [Cloacibacillus porcorum]MCI5866458.1 DUF177 domain-containing protein [Cloacibacillus porcorum]